MWGPIQWLLRTSSSVLYATYLTLFTFETLSASARAVATATFSSSSSSSKLVARLAGKGRQNQKSEFVPEMDPESMWGRAEVLAGVYM